MTGVLTFPQKNGQNIGIFSDKMAIIFLTVMIMPKMQNLNKVIWSNCSKLKIFCNGIIADFCRKMFLKCAFQRLPVDNPVSVIYNVDNVFEQGFSKKMAYVAFGFAASGDFEA